MTSVGGTPAPPGTVGPSGNSLVNDIGFEYLKEDVIESWDSTGSESMLNLAHQAVQKKDFSLLITVFYEVLSACSKQQLTTDSVAQLINGILENKGNSVIQLFVHTFSMFPLTEPLKEVILQSNIEKNQLLLFLEPQTSVELGVADPMFEKRIVRTNTNLLYKQKRFNLLREETEGFSKLIVEVHSAINNGGKSHSKHRARETAKTIESLVGYFDLDPLRSLDILLDIGATNLLDHAGFFLNILENSPWWPKSPAKPASIQEIGDGGSQAAAQLLGFKFKCYAANNEEPPESLVMLTAFLIKRGFVCLGDVYEALSPSDKDLEAYEETWKQDMDKQAFMAKASALALAAPLGDDSDSTGGSSNKKDEQTEADVKLTPQKVLLLRGLLSLGSVYPSLYILARFPFLANAFPELSDLLLRWTEYCIQPLYNKCLSFTPTEETRAVRLLPRMSRGETTLAAPKTGPHHRNLDPFAGNQRVCTGPYYTFFYKKWNDELTQIDDIKGLTSVSETYLKFVGPLLSRNNMVLVKLCRIGCNFINGESSTDDPFWLEYFRLYILPAVSLVEDNPTTIYEIYNLLGQFSFEARYALYGEWNAVLAKSSPHLKIATSKAEKGTKDVLKRLSKTNVKEMMRKLAKLSYSNPIPCFTVFIGQVESYDNLGDLVVDAARYFTDLGWDVLPYVIMTQLTSGRGTYQVDGLNDRKWLQCKFQKVHE
ncbi:hypothetical protein TRICI_006891 [Trichomonascus ciferrii]|uniref:THO complex subunit 2 N-terminal domain-containing protein n=1 Tax=Trichomonascus ciferrii TaxID=44093 RepID=A0A6A1LN74_9ASCO|nr:hypothetical protein TRICI_006891 [Trichomonascus ciferrii]